MSDNRVIELRKILDDKVKNLGVEPKAKYKTNLKVGDVNVLTLNLDNCVKLLAEILSKQDYIQKAVVMVGDIKIDDYQEVINDLVLRCKILKYKKDKLELDALQKQLDNLRSEELRKNDSLDELEKLLK